VCLSWLPSIVHNLKTKCIAWFCVISAMLIDVLSYFRLQLRHPRKKLPKIGSKVEKVVEMVKM